MVEDDENQEAATCITPRNTLGAAEEGEEEEDWSDLLIKPDHGFAQHERRLISISSRISSSRVNDDGENDREEGKQPLLLDLECVSSLSPLDMLELSQGTHDATGHKVWLGALFFLEVLNSNHRHLQKLGLPSFDSKRILELGCGTGVSGIALLKAHRPLHVTMTDADISSLGLCRRNAKRNLSDIPNATGRYQIIPLKWGDVDASTLCDENKTARSTEATTTTTTTTLFDKQQQHDVVLATDVLYDIGALAPLIWTANAFLKHQGHFILSHVPRASLDSSSNQAVAHGIDLEEKIKQVASQSGLHCTNIIRPRDLMLSGGIAVLANGISIQEMEDAGAAIMIFEKDLYF